MTEELKPLTPEELCRSCDPARLPFASTDDLEDPAEAVGQARAVAAVLFGIGIRHQGYNLFAMGPTETGKRTLVSEHLERQAATEPAPCDFGYLHNFAEPHRPKALRLAPGRGKGLRRGLESLVKELRTAIVAALEGEEQRNRKQAIEEEMKERSESAFAELKAKAAERGLALLHTPLGIGFAPLAHGEVVSPEAFAALPEADRQRLERETEALQGELQAMLARAHEWTKQAREKLKALLRELTLGAVGHLFDDLKGEYPDLPQLVSHLDEMQQHVVENVADFLRPADAEGEKPGGPLDVGTPPGTAPFRRYLFNLLVDNSQTRGAPVVFEESPTYQNLVGRIEHLAQYGALLTDFHLIKAGALHRANGGYLVLDAHQLLGQPYAWEGLKRALRSREVRIESVGQMLSLVSTLSLEPEPIPLDVKVVLLGERHLYYLLDRYDPEFRPLFKVVADFEEDLERTPDNDLCYARLVAATVRREGLLPFDRTAVARVLERSSRLSGDAEKLSAHVGTIADLLREADFWAREGTAGRVQAEHVERAVEAEQERAGRIRERALEEIRRGTYLIDSDGSRVGQVNGLSVGLYGPFAFGRPTRITAKVRLGKGDVLDIEREVALGGPIHSKGVLILTGFLGSRYALEHPLSLQATLVFEQSYGQVEGDSASSAELYALLSALAEVPIRQSFAVTGSVNQHGEVQAIGGVNEKIEGFFALCRARGLTGGQGVLIPAANVKHLMLRPDVVEAVREQRFQIYAVDRIDQGIELLTGVAAGSRDASGRFPDGSINQRVEARLEALAERRMALGRMATKAGGE